jgi:shikimate kinase
MSFVSSRDEIVLIGPHRAGKSTLAALLAAKLGVPVCALDEVKWCYFREAGYDAAEGKQVRAAQGFLGFSRFLKPYAIAMVERVLAEHRNCVFDFGAGHSMYEDEAQAARVQQALAPFRHVVLVLPSSDVDESVRVLRERSGPWTPDGATEYFDFHTYEVTHPLNAVLASHTLYTAGRTPDQACDEILRLLTN